MCFVGGVIVLHLAEGKPLHYSSLFESILQEVSLQSFFLLSEFVLILEDIWVFLRHLYLFLLHLVNQYAQSFILRTRLSVGTLIVLVYQKIPSTPS